MRKRGTSSDRNPKPAHASSPWRRRKHAALLAAAAGTTALLAGLLPSADASQASSAPPYEPITLQKITLPDSIKDASNPAWTTDGTHLLFSSYSSGDLYEVGTDGTGLNCLTCGLDNKPALKASSRAAYIEPFPDGKRILWGPVNDLSVLDCGSDVADCTSPKLFPVDLSAARPDGQPGTDLASGMNPQLAPDGEHLAFSDARTDTAEMMLIATLVPGPSAYTVTDPRVINPPGPTSRTDTDPVGWSNSASLDEFKAFTDGGASATFVRVNGGNPDVWKIDLATGKTHRLTANPDWDETDSVSPDGRSLIQQSFRTMHRTDFNGLLPIRGFVDAAEASAETTYFVASPAAQQCGLQPWLLPADGDQNADILGQPLFPYTGGDIHPANNNNDESQWSPDGTAVVSNTLSYTTGLAAPYLVVAHLDSRKPTTPIPTVSSQPGSWAPSPQDFPAGAIASNTTVTVKGQAAGTADLSYAGSLTAGTDSVTYHHYSDDGHTFVDGTKTITNKDATADLTITADLTLTGTDTGSQSGTVTFTGQTAAGSITSTLNGATLTGPGTTGTGCPDDLPGLAPLKVTATATSASASASSGSSTVTAHVTSSIKGAGTNEQDTDTRPVTHATVTVVDSGQTATTDANGNATLTVPKASGQLHLQATAGNTMTPDTTTVRVP